MNEILRQINEGIQVINIETYIAMSEQIVEAIRARDFSNNNSTLAIEIAAAEMRKLELSTGFNNSILKKKSIMFKNKITVSFFVCFIFKNIETWCSVLSLNIKSVLFKNGILKTLPFKICLFKKLLFKDFEIILLSVVDAFKKKILLIDVDTEFIMSKSVLKLVTNILNI